MQYVKIDYNVTSEQNITQEEFQEISQAHINSGSLFLWKDDNGIAVAMCGIELSEDIGKVKLVYTTPTTRMFMYNYKKIIKMS